MKKDLEIRNVPVFYLKRRRRFEKINNLRIVAQGIMLNHSKKDGVIFLEKDNIILSDEKQTLYENNEILLSCINLGQFVANNPDIMEDLATCYLINENIEHRKYIIQSRPLDDINQIKLITLKQSYKYLDSEKINNIDFNKFSRRFKSKYMDNVKLRNLLIKWINTCGLSNEEISQVLYGTKQYLIPMEALLKILDLSLEIYNIYQALNDKKLMNVEVCTILHYEFKENVILTQRILVDIYNAALYMLLTSYKDNYKSFGICKNCNNLYFRRRKDQIYCDINCKDKMKYKKRKERHRKE